LLLGTNATEMTVLSGFWQKNGLGTLGVKVYWPCWTRLGKKISFYLQTIHISLSIHTIKVSKDFSTQFNSSLVQICTIEF